MESPQFAKLALRDQVLAARRQLTLAERTERAQAIAEHVLAMPQVRKAATIAAYVSVGREPGTGPLLDALRAAGKRVILPLLRPDNDLDWAVYTGSRFLRSAPRGLLEPMSPPLGIDALATADLVLVPALAVGYNGIRLGRGGGSYDRALPRATGTLVAIVNAEEILESVPADAHDRAVQLFATPEGVVSAQRQDR